MYKIILIALVCAVLIIYLKNINSELAILAEIMSGIILIFYSLSYLKTTFSFFNELISLSGLDDKIFGIILKIIAIGYLIEFGASTIEDFGLKSLATKLIFVGKIIIICMAMPIIYAVFNVITGLLT